MCPPLINSPQAVARRYFCAKSAVTVYSVFSGARTQALMDWFARQAASAQELQPTITTALHAKGFFATSLKSSRPSCLRGESLS